MKASELRNHNETELQTMIAEQTNLLYSLQFNHKVSPIENPRRITLLRKDIARMKTILNERKAR